jgi:hypothetical protein
MRTKCGVEYEAGVEKPENARFALWSFGDVRLFPTKEEAEKALEVLPPSKKGDATIGELEK